MCQTMKTNELEHFRDLLIAQRDELLQATRRHGKIPSERVDTDDNDLTDQANVAVTRDLNNTIAKSEDFLLKKIDDALESIANGTYGSCAQCQESIPVDRLRAKPSVSLCVPCQTKKESSVA